MPDDHSSRDGIHIQMLRRDCPKRRCMLPGTVQAEAPDIDVGWHLRELRLAHGLSIRALAEISGLNVNTLSLIENGKTSPSVSTLQQLAGALEVPVKAFFEDGGPKSMLSHQQSGQRAPVHFSQGSLEDLGAGLSQRAEQAFLVTLEAQANSGPAPIVHTGLELVYCLEGRLAYSIEQQTYLLEPGDSLFFEAHLPHRWQNAGDSRLRWLLVMCPASENDDPAERHFKAAS